MSADNAIGIWRRGRLLGDTWYVAEISASANWDSVKELEFLFKDAKTFGSEELAEAYARELNASWETEYGICTIDPPMPCPHCGQPMEKS